MAEPVFAYGELLKLVVALGVTIGLFYALALFMKRLQVGTGKSGSLITVLAALPLGAKEKLWIVDVAGEKLVIGTAPGNVNCLHVLKDTPSSFPRTRESSVVDANKDIREGDEATPSSFPRTRESSVVDADKDIREGDEATPSSFPRRRESSVVDADKDIREGDEVQASAPAFAELLSKFRGWQK